MMQRLINLLFAIAIVLLYVVALAGNVRAAEPVKALRDSAVHLPHGSGIVVKKPNGKTVIISNAHVCVWESGSLKIDTARGVKVTHILHMNLEQDLCALEAPSNLKGIDLASRTPLIGDDLYTRGYPEGLMHESHGLVLDFERMELNLPELVPCPSGFMVARSGLIQTQCTHEFDFMSTNLFVLPGSSGSGVVNRSGELVGIVQTYEGTPRSGGVLLLENVRKFVESL